MGIVKIGPMLLAVAGGLSISTSGTARAEETSGQRAVNAPPEEIIETIGGRAYRGRVIGYESSTKSYLVLVDGSRTAIPESEILTIRNVLDVPAGTLATIEKRTAPAQAGRTSSPAVQGPAEKDRAAKTAPDRPATSSTSSTSSDGDLVTLESLIRQASSFPIPGKPEAREALDAAWGKLRGGEPLAAVEPLTKALAADPACPGPAALLAAVRLDVERDPAAAHGIATAALARTPDFLPLVALASRTSLALGYRNLHAKLEGARIAARYEGAEREYRMFRFLQIRDPEAARKAWSEYRRLDPRWEKATAEGRAARDGIEAIDGGDEGRGIGILARAVEDNPLLAEEARPHLVRAFLARARKSETAGRHEFALADLRAAAEEDPGKAEEIAARRKEIEDAWTKVRLAGATTAEEIEEASHDLGRLIEDVKGKCGPAFAGALSRIAAEAASREDFDGTVRCLKATETYGAKPEAAVLEKLAAIVAGDIARRDTARAGERLGVLEALPRDGTGLDGRLVSLRSDLEKALRPSKDADDADRADRLASAPPPAPASRRPEVSVEGAPSTPEAAAGPSTMPYLPLIAGTRWSYVYGDGSKENQVLERIEEGKDGETVYRFASALVVRDDKVPYHKTGRFSGQYFQITSGMRSSGVGDRVLKLPVVLGDRWTWRKGDIVCEREYVATDAKVESRAGTFENCLKVKATSRFDAGGTRTRPIEQYFYYAPNVGLVRIEGETALDGRELEEFAIGGGGKGQGESRAPVAADRSPGSATPVSTHRPTSASTVRDAAAPPAHEAPAAAPPVGGLGGGTR
jgi:hypothetical protein